MDNDEIDKKVLDVRLDTLETQMKLSLVTDKDLIERVQSLELAVYELIKQQQEKK